MPFPGGPAPTTVVYYFEMLVWRIHDGVKSCERAGTTSGTTRCEKDIEYGITFQKVTLLDEVCKEAIGK